MSKSILLIVDMISAWDFPGADAMAESAPPAVAAMAEIRRSVGDDVATVYANDLEEGFHGSRDAAIQMAMSGRQPELVEPLLPDAGDAFIHKGQHSAFYGTPLAHLLKLSAIENIILTGKVTEQCVLYTALDSHVRGFEITVPVDAVISQRADLGAAALAMIETNMNGRLTGSKEMAGAAISGSHGAGE